MKLILALITLAMTSTAVAGNGAGALTCSSRSGDIVAVYSFFHSMADSYSEATVFIQNAESGKYDQFSGSAEEALKPVEVKTNRGKLVVKANLKTGACTLQE